MANVFKIILCLAFVPAYAWSGMSEVRSACFEPMKQGKKFRCDLREEQKYEVDDINQNYTSGDFDAQRTGISKRGTLIKEIKAIQSQFEARGDSLSSCELGALVKCVTAKFMTYDENKDPMRRLSLEQIYAGEKGLCREYSTVFYDLAQAVGLKALIIGGRNGSLELHAFNGLDINGVWYTVEPQSSAPLFRKITPETSVIDFHFDSTGKHVDDDTVLNPLEESK
ncbi:MAG: transglutaminase domain-containing protein [Pseudobdellovibrionaceae bacterium]